MADVLSQQGKPQEALALYEESLHTEGLGDVREVAVTQNAMADVLSQQGKPQEALALYKESLRTKKELGDVRGVAVTQMPWPMSCASKASRKRLWPSIRSPYAPRRS